MSKSLESLKFSVLIPSYNGEDIIAIGINSILAQDYSNLEIIVNDDASTDDTEKVVKKFKDKRVKFFKNKNNLGYPGNLNQCLSHATGDIIYLLGQDDILSKNAIKLTSKAFQMSPDIGVVTSPYRQFDESLNVTIRARFPLNPNQDEVVKITDDYVKIVEVFKSLDSLSALGYRAKFIDRPFHPDIFPCHVYPFASIFKKHPIVYLKDYVSSVSMRKSQCWHLSSIYDKSPVLSWAQMFENIFPEKKFKKLRKYCIENFVAINYVGLAQIKNYSRHSHWYTLREILYLLKFRMKNLISPIFWFFSLGALLTPRFLFIPIVDWYKKNVNVSLLKSVSFKSPFIHSPKLP